MSSKYYLIRRPPMPGAVPRGAESMEDFGERRQIPGIGPAWGSVTYKAPLSAEQIEQYELKASNCPASPEEAGLSCANEEG